MDHEVETDQALAPSASRPGLSGLLATYLELTKPRIVLLLLVTALCAMVLAAHGWPNTGLVLFTMLGLGLSAGGANAVNMWYDRDIDPLMERTKSRPVPSGRLPATHALAFGIAAGVVSTALLFLAAGWVAALAALAGYIYYVFIYTIWLKRRTPQNIVIGGGAGAFPPLVGWAAVTGHLALAPVLLFLIIFLWTPPHFWALALYRQDDYRRASIPMLPVVAGDRVTKWQSLLYTVALLVSSLLLYTTGTVSALYLWVAATLGGGFIVVCALQLFEHPPDFRWARITFRYSLIYLTVLFAAVVLSVRA